MLDLIRREIAEETLRLSQIRTDGGTQPRGGIREDVVADYAATLEDGGTLPPIDVTHDGFAYWLWDGFHRLEAYRMAGLDSIPVKIHQGTLADAQWASYAANKAHGLRRTNEDKERAVRAALRHAAGATMSDRQIARHVGVDHRTIGRYRAELTTGGEIPHVTERAGADGKTYQTAGISQSNRDRPKPANAPSVSVPLTRVLGKCRLCGAGLTDPESVARGYGPECADRMARAAQQDAYKGSDGQAMIEASEAYAAATLAAMAAGQTPPDVAAAMVEPSTELPGAGALDDDGEAPPVLPVDLVALGCRLAVEDGFYHVRYGSHRSEYASFEGAIAWCRRITGTDGSGQTEPQGTRQERIAGLLALYQQVLESLPEYGALTGDFTGALPLRRVLEPMVTRLEANVTKGTA